MPHQVKDRIKARKANVSVHLGEVQLRREGNEGVAWLFATYDIPATVHPGVQESNELYLADVDDMIHTSHSQAAKGGLITAEGRKYT